MKKITFPLALLLLLVALRIVLEPILLSQVNKNLSVLSPDIKGHVDRLHIGIIRGVFGLSELTLRLRGADENFLRVREAEVSLAWREILRGNLMADAIVDGVDFTFDERLPRALKRALPVKDPSEPKKRPPMRLGRVDWKNVNIIYPTPKAYTNQGPFRLRGVNGRITNLFADKKTPRSFFHVSGKGSGSSEFKAIGSANLLADPPQWDIDAQLQGFSLVSMNRFLYRRVPVTFTKGNLDLYAEAKSVNGKIRGYVKPFFEDIDFIRTDEDFKGARHWLVEVAGAVGNWVLKAKRDKTIATKVPFTFDGKKISVNIPRALGNVIEHGFDQELSPGVDADMTLQAQEARMGAENAEEKNERKEEMKEEKN